MATLREVTIVTVGGKGSSLSSVSVYAIANGIAKVRIDSSVLEKLSPTHPLSKTSLEISNPNPEYLTLEEARASLVVLLNKLVLTQTGIRSLLPQFISETLNRGFPLETLDFSSVPGFLDSFFRLNGTNLIETGVTDGELDVLNNSCYYLDGICALLDCSSSALPTTADAVAALSCEALNADVSMVLNLLDSGDGFSIKDETAVASDMKVLLVGSKLVNGGNQSESISEIPQVHGSFREVVKLVHSRTRVELNSIVKIGKASTGTGSSVRSGKPLVTTFSSLATSLLFLGESSFRRA